MLKSRFGVRGMDVCEVFEPCPDIVGGFENLGVCERLEASCGRISAGGARAALGIGGDGF